MSQVFQKFRTEEQELQNSTSRETMAKSFLELIKNYYSLLKKLEVWGWEINTIANIEANPKTPVMKRRQ